MEAMVEHAVHCETHTGQAHALKPGWAYVSSSSYRALMDHFESERDQIDVIALPC